MQTRPHQNLTRAKEEQWLIDAIHDNDIDAAKIIINMIVEKGYTHNTNHLMPQLDYIDADGNSFLFLSLANQAKSISRLLYEHLKDNESVLLAKNKNNQTLLWITAKNQNKEMLEILFPIFLRHHKTHPNDQPAWFLRDTEGNTLLHASVITGNKTETAAYLLEILQNIKGEAELIHQLNTLTNNEGNTALHLAFEYNNLQMAALLTQHGADWSVINDKKKSPFDYFCDYSNECQKILMSLLALEKENTRIINQTQIDQSGKEIVVKTEKKFSTSDRTYQNYVLNLYQQHLINCHEKTSKESYLTLAAGISLRNVFIANTIINDSIKKIWETSLENTKIILPHDDHFEIEIANNHPEEIIIELDSDESQTENFPDDNKHSLSPLQQKNMDRLSLTVFINKLDAYIADLKQSPRPNILLPLSIAFAVLNWLIFIAVEGWMIYDLVNATNKAKCKKNGYAGICEDRDYSANTKNLEISRLQIALFSLLYFLFAFLTTLTPVHLKKKEGLISKTEWNELIVYIEQTFLIHLQSPFTEEHRKQLTELHAVCDELHDKQERMTVIDIFERISLSLKKIRMDLNLGHYPNGLLFFTPHSKEPHFDNDSFETENESALLLLKIN